MKEVTTIGIGLAKYIFLLHGVDRHINTSFLSQPFLTEIELFGFLALCGGELHLDPDQIPVGGTSWKTLLPRLGNHRYSIKPRSIIGFFEVPWRSVSIYVYIFFDPHCLWQRPTNENTNGLLRQHFPKGTDLSPYSQQHLTTVAEELNNRPRKPLGFRTPDEFMAEKIKDLNSGIALQN